MATTGEQPVVSSRRSYAWIWFVGVGLVVLASYYALPAAGVESRAVLAGYPALTAAAAIAVLVGVALHRPVAPAPWLLLAAGQSAYVVGDWYTTITEWVTGETPGLSVADVFFLLQYPLIIAALAVFVRRRTPGSHAPALTDAAVLSIAVGLLWWVYIVSQIPVSGSALQQAVALAYPVMDLLVLAVALRLTLGVGSRTVSFRLLVAALVVMLPTDVLYSIATANDVYELGGPIDAGYMVAYILLGAAALHPSMRWLDQRAAAAVTRVSPRRIALLTGAAVLPLAILLVQYLRGTSLYVPLLAVGGAVLVVLMVVRLRGLVHSQRRLAIVDDLTEAYTRDFFDEAMDLHWQRTHILPTPFGVVLVDMDNLALVNEMHGYSAGDLVLAEAARRLRGAVRPGDVVARYDSDLFMVLLPGVDQRDTTYLAERMREAVSAQRFRLGAGSIRVTASIGLATLPSDGRTPEEVVRVADQALYTAKRAGRNRVYSRFGPVQSAPAGVL